MNIIHGDCIEAMAGMEPNSIDAIVTDPPYGLGFMGKAWDALPPGEEWARECLRVLKPGGHLLAFGGTRTWHRLAVAVEDAGFEIRDSIAWAYSSGFPKSQDVAKMLDKRRDDRPDILRVTTFMADHAEARGITRKQVDSHMGTSDMAGWWLSRLLHRCQCPKWEQWAKLKDFLALPDDMDAEVWRLNGRKGKPGEAWNEREVTGMDSRKAQSSWLGTQDGRKGTWGVGEWEVSAPASDDAKQWQGWGTALKPAFEPIVMARKPLAGTVAANVVEFGTGAINIEAARNGERWPANVVTDEQQADTLGTSRFFYVAKAPKKERPVVDGIAHPTVKPLALMRWLCRLVTPEGGTILDPFAGSGTTLEAAALEGFQAIGIEAEADYLPLIQARLDRIA